jgi:hypothetical protein
VLAACLQRDREKRLPDAVTLRARLLPFAGRGDATSRPSLPGGRRETESAATMAAPATSAPGSAAIEANEARRLAGETLSTWTGDHGGKRRGRLLIGGSLVAAAAAAVSAWFVLRPAPPHVGASPVTGVTGTSSPVTSAAPRDAARPAGDARGGPSVTPLEPAIAASAAASAAPEASASPSKPPSQPHVSVGPAVPPHPTASPSASAKKPKEDLGI